MWSARQQARPHTAPKATHPVSRTISHGKPSRKHGVAWLSTGRLTSGLTRAERPLTCTVRPSGSTTSCCGAKPLPSGSLFDLDDTVRGAYLYHRSELGEFFLAATRSSRRSRGGDSLRRIQSLGGRKKRRS